MIPRRHRKTPWGRPCVRVWAEHGLVQRHGLAVGASEPLSSLRAVASCRYGDGVCPTWELFVLCLLLNTSSCTDVGLKADLPQLLFVCWVCSCAGSRSVVGV